MLPVVELQQVTCGPLHGLDLLAYPGERVGVLAAPGGGSTALVELLAGARGPEAGRIRRDGFDVTGSRLVGGDAGGLPGVAVLARRPRLFPRLTVYENVLVAALAVRRRSHRVADAHARRALSRLGLDDVAHRSPRELSTSDAVRLDAARAVAAPRDLVIVDQLAGRVDARTRHDVADLLADAVAEGAALVWLEDERTPPPDVDRLVVLGHGRVVQQGPPDVVLTSPAFRRPAPDDGPAAQSDPVAPSDPAAARNAAAPGAGVTAGGGTATFDETRKVRGRAAGRRGHAALMVTRWSAPAGSTLVTAPTVRDVSLDVAPRELLAVVGRPGAGTSVLLRSLAGLVEARGELWLGAVELTGASAAGRARAGLGFVPQDGGVVDDMTVAEHLSLGRRRRLRRRWTPGEIYGLFPSLGQARDTAARLLPPLERRCLAVARALVADPTVLLVDRPALGLPDRSVPVVLDALTEVTRHAAVVVAEAPAGPVLTLGGRVVALEGGMLRQARVDRQRV